MASDTFTIKQGDTLPVLRRRFEDESGGVIDLEAASSVTFRMRPFRRSVVVLEAAANIEEANPTDPDATQVAYTWAAGDTDVAGTYEAEWEIVFATGDVLTVPNDRSMIVEIVPQLG